MKKTKTSNQRKETKLSTRGKVIFGTIYYLVIVPVGSLLSIIFFNSYVGISPAQIPVDFSIIILYLALPIIFVMGSNFIDKRNPKDKNSKKINKYDLLIVVGIPILVFFAADKLIYPGGKFLLLNFFGKTVDAQPVDAYFVSTHFRYGGPHGSSYTVTYRVNDPAEDDVVGFVVEYKDINNGKKTKIIYNPAETVHLQEEQYAKIYFYRPTKTIRYVRFAPLISELK